MTKYLIKRILRALLSVVLVVAVIMIMVYACLDRQAIFGSDPNYPKMLNNKKQTYMMSQWEKFGYLDYIPYADFLTAEYKAGNITEEEMKAASTIGATAEKDSEATAKMVALFMDKYDNKDGYKVERHDGLVGRSR